MSLLHRLARVTITLIVLLGIAYYAPKIITDIGPSIGRFLYTPEDAPPVSSAAEEFIDGKIEITMFITKYFGIHNLSGRSIPVVHVDCGFFDATGALLATDSKDIENIAPGETAYDSVFVSKPKSEWVGDISTRCRAQPNS